MPASDHTTRPEIRELPFAIGIGVSSDGSMWSRKGKGCKPKLANEWHPLKQTIDSLGYPGIGVYKDGQVRRHRTHVLVLTMFVGPCPDGREGLHWDGDKTNNDVSNLRWGTRSENMKDAVRQGSHVRPLSSGRREMTPEQVRSIPGLRRRGLTQEQVGKLLGVSQTNISSIERGKTWGHLNE